MRVGKPALFSDHACISLTLQLGQFTPKQKQPYRAWNLAKADWDFFSLQLDRHAEHAAQECLQLAENKDPQLAADLMVEKIEALYNQAAIAAVGEKVVDSKRRQWWYGDQKLTELFS